MIDALLRKRCSVSRPQSKSFPISKSLRLEMRDGEAPTTKRVTMTIAEMEPIARYRKDEIRRTIDIGRIGNTETAIRNHMRILFIAATTFGASGGPSGSCTIFRASK